MFRLPRNFPFFNKLPQRFYIKILQKRNTISEGTWYFVEINQNRLNLLSRTKLKLGSIFYVEKKNDFELKILKEVSKEEFNKLNKGKNQFIDILG